MKPKRHHYVPQSYLQRFVDQTDGMLWVFDKKESEARKQKPINTAVEGHYYSVIDDEGCKDPWIETDLTSPVDGIANPILERWAQDPKATITPNEKGEIAYFLGLMYTRVPRTIDTLKEIGVKAILGEMQHIADDETKAKWAYEESFCKHACDTSISFEKFLELLKNPEQYFEISMKHDFALASSMIFTNIVGDHLLDLEWVLVDAPQNRLFITSDSPVVSCVQYRGDIAHFGVGFGHPNVQVSFPISPSLCLYMDRSRRQPRFRGTGKRIKELNKRTIHIAERFVFSSRRFRKLEQWIEDSSVLFGKSRIDREEVSKMLSHYRNFHHPLFKLLK
jgi:hypothetical protein